jgi:transposase
MDPGYAGPQIVGIDLHRRRSVMVRMTPTGEQAEAVRFTSDADMLTQQIAKAGTSPQVVRQATYGWYWAADVLTAAGAQLHLAHPLGVKGFTYRRVKNDVRDAADLADLLRMGRLPQAWIAPPAVRELRELVRHRHKLRQMCSSLKAQVHAVVAKCGLLIPVSDLFGMAGRAQLAALELAEVFRARLDSQLHLIDVLQGEVATFDGRIARSLAGHPGYTVIQVLPGIGPVWAAVFVAEIGPPQRFTSPAHLCSWAGLTPRHRESDATIRRGPITKQGSRLVRWAAIEAVQRAPADSATRAVYDRIVARRGQGERNVAKVAAARKLLTLVYYGLRDGHIRALDAGR